MPIEPMSPSLLGPPVATELDYARASHGSQRLATAAAKLSAYAERFERIACTSIPDHYGRVARGTNTLDPALVDLVEQLAGTLEQLVDCLEPTIGAVHRIEGAIPKLS